MKKSVAAVTLVGGLLSGTVAQASVSYGVPVINEFVTSQLGSTAKQFIEVIGASDNIPGTLAILQIEGTGGSSLGRITTVHIVGTPDSNGIWFTPFMDSQLSTGSMTLLLVDSFTGSAGDDIDLDNDGEIDTPLWSMIWSSVAVLNGGVNDRTYQEFPEDLLTPDFDGGTTPVVGASRIEDAFGPWVRNNDNMAGLPGYPSTVGPNEALNTPGDFNAIPEPAIASLLAPGALLLMRRRK